MIALLLPVLTTLLAAMPDEAAARTDIDRVVAEQWLTGSIAQDTPLVNSWVSADGALRLTFRPTPSLSQGWTPPQAIATLHMDCGTLSTPYAIGRQGGEILVTFDFLHHNGSVPENCSSTERAHAEDILGQTSRGVLDGTVLRSDAGLKLTREESTPELRAFADALVLPDGRFWTPATRQDAPYGRLRANKTYFADGRVGGDDGCNGWSADYMVLPGERGPLVYESGHHSTLVACEWADDIPAPELGRGLSVRVEGGELIHRFEAGGIRWVAVTAAQHSERVFAQDRQRFLSAIGLGEGDVWRYETSYDDAELAASGLGRGYFTSIGGGPVAGHDGCNQFEGAARIVERRNEAARGPLAPARIGLALSEDGILATEMFCSSVAPPVYRLFADDAELSIHDDHLTVHQPAGLTIFRKAPSP